MFSALGCVVGRPEESDSEAFGKYVEDALLLCQLAIFCPRYVVLRTLQLVLGSLVHLGRFDYKVPCIVRSPISCVVPFRV